MENTTITQMLTLTRPYFMADLMYIHYNYPFISMCSLAYTEIGNLSQIELRQTSTQKYNTKNSEILGRLTH